MAGTGSGIQLKGYCFSGIQLKGYYFSGPVLIAPGPRGEWPVSSGAQLGSELPAAQLPFLYLESAVVMYVPWPTKEQHLQETHGTRGVAVSKGNRQWRPPCGTKIPSRGGGLFIEM